MIAHHEGGLVGRLTIVVDGAHHEDARDNDTVCKSLNEAGSHGAGDEESVDGNVLSQAKANDSESLNQEHYLGGVELAASREKAFGDKAGRCYNADALETEGLERVLLVDGVGVEGAEATLVDLERKERSEGSGDHAGGETGDTDEKVFEASSPHS